MISILLLSWERFDLLKQSLDHNLKTVGCAYELLVCDQGSKDPRVIPYLNSKNPTYFRENKRNEGVGRAFNQLFLRSKKSIIVTMPNDILYPVDWGMHFVKWLTYVENPGLCCIDWGHGARPPLTKRDGIEAHWARFNERVFGPMGVTRELINEIGFFYEGFSHYGMEDSDFNDRALLAGKNNFYIPKLFARHLGTDGHDSGEYRKSKDVELAEASRIFDERIIKLKNGEIPIKTSLPEMRGPLT